MRGFRDLVAWQKAMALVTDVYRLTQSFPREEVYGLTSQLRRAAVSIPSNLAEGQGRASPGEFRHFVGQARGSLLELETQLEIAHNLSYVDDAALHGLQLQVKEIGKLLNGLLSWCDSRTTVKKKNSQGAA